MRIEFTIETRDGKKNFADPLLKKRLAIINELERELYLFAEEVMTESKMRVPVDTGALMNTGKVLPPEYHAGGKGKDEISIQMGYGDESVKYALYVHENLDPHVKWTRPGSGPKYLENPLKEKQDELPDRLADAIRRGLEA